METKILPYSPEWFKLHAHYFTGSDAHKLMTEPRGKNNREKFEDHSVKLAEWEAKYSLLPEGKKLLKSNVKLLAKIESGRLEYAKLEAVKDQYRFSDTAETYILEKVHGKLTGLIKSGIDNAATQWGIENEPLAKKWYTRITGNEIGDPFFEFHPTIEGFSCTPDGEVGTEGLMEVKCPHNGAIHLKHWLISSDEVLKEEFPDKYWQMISQMNIMSREWCDFVSFDPRINNDRGMFIYRLNYNEQDGQALEERVKLARGLFNDYYGLFSAEKLEEVAA